MLLLRIIIIFLIVLAFFASYNIWILEKKGFIKEENIVYSTSSQLKLTDGWADIIIEEN